MQIYVNGLGVYTPGMENWEQAAAVLAAGGGFSGGEEQKIKLGLLQPNERRRTTKLIRLALEVAQQAVGPELQGAADYATVFAASDGDHEVVDRMCTALTLPERPVSPTNFHNSVHNAPAGYWAIAAAATVGSTSLCACDESFAAGLLEAAALVTAEDLSVLLVAYDYPPPESLALLRRMDAIFGVALLLGPAQSSSSVASLEIGTCGQGDISRCDDPGLEALRRDNPAARSLPLLEMLAGHRAGEVLLPAVRRRRVSVKVAPCR